MRPFPEPNPKLTAELIRDILKEAGIDLGHELIDSYLENRINDLEADLLVRGDSLIWPIGPYDGHKQQKKEAPKSTESRNAPRQKKLEICGGTECEDNPPSSLSTSPSSPQAPETVGPGGPIGPVLRDIGNLFEVPFALPYTPSCPSPGAGCE